MTELKFSDEDKRKVIEFLNMVATHATFELNTSQLINYFKLLSFMQQSILPKIDANVLEIKRVIESKTEEAKPTKGRK